MNNKRKNMEIYIVKEYEAIEGGGGHESIIGAWYDKESAEKYAANQNGGRYMQWDVEEVDVMDTQPNSKAQPMPRSPSTPADLNGPVRGIGCGGLLGCICHRCIREKDIRNEWGMPISSSQMIVCPECGNKRCPHASDHRFACTKSNQPGQAGSVYA